MGKHHEATSALAEAAQWLEEASIAVNDRYLKFNLKRTAENCAEVARKLEGK